MESGNEGAAGLLAAITDQLNIVVSYLPGILAMVIILAIGWTFARLARRAVRQIGAASNQWLTRMFPSGIFAGARMSSLAVALLSEVIFWAIIVISLTVAARFADFGSVSQWLDRITAQLPNVIAGVGIVLVGYFLSVFVREQFLSQTGSVASPANPILGRVAQAAVITIALIIGLDQVGIDVALLIGLTVVTTAGILTAIAVAFASGARTHISNLIGVRTAHAILSPGMTIQVGGITGEIVEFTSTLVALDTKDGRVLIPGKLTDEAVITVLTPVSIEDDSDD